MKPIEYSIIGEGSQISTNQKQESTIFSLLIGRNMRLFPGNTVLYKLFKDLSGINKVLTLELLDWLTFGLHVLLGYGGSRAVSAFVQL